MHHYSQDFVNILKLRMCLVRILDIWLCLSPTSLRSEPVGFSQSSCKILPGCPPATEALRMCLAGQTSSVSSQKCAVIMRNRSQGNSIREAGADMQDSEFQDHTKTLISTSFRVSTDKTPKQPDHSRRRAIPADITDWGTALRG